METPPYPVPEQIQQAIETTLQGVTIENGYRVEVAAVLRPKRRETTTPFDGLAVLVAGSPEQGTAETDVGGLVITRTLVCEIGYTIEPAEDVTTPLDQLQHIAVAEIERALVAAMDGEGGRAFDGLGHNAELRAPQYLSTIDGAQAGVVITIAVSYRYLDTDPYTPLN